MQDRSHATTFAVLPPGSAHPEGITTDSKGNFYVVTWDYDHPGHVDVRYFKGRAQEGISQWAAQVKVYNIVKIRIPPLLK